MNERDQMINFLLQQCDAKNRVIEELQKQVTELQKTQQTTSAQQARTN